MSCPGKPALLDGQLKLPQCYRDMGMCMAIMMEAQATFQSTAALTNMYMALGNIRRRNATSPQLVTNALEVQCSYNKHMQQGDINHTMTCNTLSGTITLLHYMLEGIVRCITKPCEFCRPYCSSDTRLKQRYSRFCENHGAVLLILSSSMTVVDFSVIHPATSTWVQED